MTYQLSSLKPDHNLEIPRRGFYMFIRVYSAVGRFFFFSPFFVKIYVYQKISLKTRNSEKLNVLIIKDIQDKKLVFAFNIEFYKNYLFGNFKNNLTNFKKNVDFIQRLGSDTSFNTLIDIF